MNPKTTPTINGVIIKELKTYPDDRGFFREVIRVSDPLFHHEDSENNINFGQWSHSKMAKGVVKAWHYHHVQTDWWYIPIGTLNVILIDDRKESSTYKAKMEFEMGENSPLCVRIPPGVLHGAQVQSEEAHLFYITSHTYNPDDEGRIPYDSQEINYNWTEPMTVADNDKKTFIPSATRSPI